MVTMAVMNEAYSFNKPPQLIGNFDATQFILTGNSEELLVTIKKNHPDDIIDGDVENQPLSSVADTKLSQAVKWMMLANANGNLSVDVFLLSDPDMESEEFSFYQISGLSHSTDPKSFGYLCFTKTRAGNLKFFLWYITAIVIPFVNECRSLLSTELEDDHFYLVADGEEVQIKPVDDDEVNNALMESRIDLGKGPASCTDTVGNACDRSNLFKASKKILKSQTSVTVNDFRDPILENKIKSTISENHISITNSKAQFMSVWCFPP